MSVAGEKNDCGSSCGTSSCATSDLAGTPKSLIKVWGLPVLLFVVGFFDPFALRSLLWFVALTIAGGACLLNAFQCGRMHCYFSGPYFLLCAVVVSLAGFGVIALKPSEWTWFGIAIAVSVPVVYFLPEYLWGRYAGSHKNGGVVLESTITCPHCSKQSTHTMPTESCQFFMECPHCKVVLRPKKGDCCVFCTYGTVKCPSKQ